MLFKNLVLLGLVGSISAKNMPMGLRKIADNGDKTDVDLNAGLTQHLDLEVIENGDRKLFPLLPGTKCPTGMTCRARTHATVGKEGPMSGSLKNSLKTPLAMQLNWEEFNTNLDKVVVSDDYCDRRKAMARAAGMIAGVSAAAVATPAYAAETKEVKMGTDSGGLQFVPAKVTICSGDTVKWINNKAGPHNVVFDEDAIPAGVDQEKISMEDQLGEEGESFSMSFTEKGTYEFYCEPHRGAGMNGVLVVQ